MSNAWSDLGQLVVLAIRLPPVRKAALLEGEVGGVASARSWGLVVRVRKSDGVERNGLELAFDEDDTANEAELLT